MLTEEVALITQSRNVFKIGVIAQIVQNRE